MGFTLGASVVTNLALAWAVKKLSQRESFFQLRLGRIRKRRIETMAFRFEIDERADISLPPLVDDDGDPFIPTTIDWISSDPSIAQVHGLGDDPTVPVGAADLRVTVDGTGTVGLALITGTPRNDEGVGADYVLDLSIGTGIPVGGDLTAGNVRKL